MGGWGGGGRDTIGGGGGVGEPRTGIIYTMFYGTNYGFMSQTPSLFVVFQPDLKVAFWKCQPLYRGSRVQAQWNTGC